MLTMYHRLVHDTVMPQVSRIRLDKTAEKKLLSTLELVFSKISKQEDMNMFLLSLMTQVEKLMLAKRLAIIFLLKEGYNDSEIASALNVTRVTVSRLKYFYESHGEGYEVALKVLQNEQVLTDLKTVMIKLMAYAARAAGGRVKPTIL